MTGISVSARPLRVPPEFLLVVALQSLLLIGFFQIPDLLIPATAAIAALLLLVLLPIPVGIGAFLIAGAYLPLLGLRQRYYLGALGVLFAVLCLADFIRLVRRGRLLPERTVLSGPARALTALLGIGIVVGLVQGSPIEDWPQEAFPYLSLLLAPVAARYLTLPAIRKIFIVFTVLVLVQSAFALFYFSEGGFFRIRDARYSIHPSLAAVVLSSMAVFLRSRKWRRLAAGGAVVLLLQLVTTMTRGYWLGFLAGFVTVLAFAGTKLAAAEYRKLLLRVLLLAFLLIAATLIVLQIMGLLESLFFLGNRFASITELGADASTQVRMTEWKFALKEFLRYPVLGAGFGYHLEFYHPVHRQRFWQWWFVHNHYILVLLKTGIVGFGAFAIFVSGILRTGVRAVRRRRSGASLAFAVGFAANIVQLLVVAVTNYTFNKAVNTTYLVFALGALAVLARDGTSEDEGRPGGGEAG